MPSTIDLAEVTARLCQLASEHAKPENIPPGGVTPDLHLVNDLGFDSLDVVEYTMEIEEAYDVSIPDEASQQVGTIQQAIDLLAPMLR